MKILRKMGVVFFSIILVNLMGLFVLSKEIKPLLINGVIKETLLKEYIVNTNEIDSNNNMDVLKENIDNETLQEMLDSKEVQDLINKYLDILMNSITNDKEIDNINIEEDIYEYIKNNKSIIEKVTGEEITDEKMNELEKEIKKGEISQKFKDTIENERNAINPNIKKILSIFTFFTSQKFRIYCIIGIIISLLLIALLELSLYKWIKTLGASMITTGICTIAMSLLFPFTLNRLSNININLINLTTIGIGLLVWGILLVITYKIIDSIIKRKKMVKNDLSEEVKQ